MPITGLDIYKLLPKTNCKKCGFATCLAFAMALAAKKTALEKCPDVTEDAKRSLEEASEPPIKTIAFQDGDRTINLGGETVLFRHEKTFWNPCGLGVYISDEMDEEQIGKIISDFGKLTFERIGQIVRSEFIYIENKLTDTSKFVQILKRILSTSAFIIARSTNIGTLSQILKEMNKKVILSGARSSNYRDFLKLAQEMNCPLAITATSLDDISKLTAEISGQNFKNIIIELQPEDILKTVNTLTQIRRLSLKKNIRSLGYPVLVSTISQDIYSEVAEASHYIEKYASIVVTKTSEVAAHMALVSLRQNIYTDPQKPVAVEPKLYKFGNVTENSPVLITTNFSLTYYSVAPEIENSKVASYLLVVDTEGMSVLTAWAADKFTSEKVNDAMKKENLSEIVKHKKIIIPGYVSIMSGKLNDVTGWDVLVGPREASGIPKFLKSL